jgi:hypothetical protein
MSQTMSYYLGIILSTMLKQFINISKHTELLPTSITNDTVKCRDCDLDNDDFATIGRPLKVNLPAILLFDNNV